MKEKIANILIRFLKDNHTCNWNYHTSSMYLEKCTYCQEVRESNLHPTIDPENPVAVQYF